MEFEELHQKDLQNITHLQPDGWSDIITEFEFYVNSPYCHPVKTEINSHIVGVGAVIEFGKTAWLAHIIVDPERRRMGIGSRIVEVLLKYLDSRSIDTCLLIATEMGLPVYKRAGFRVISEYAYLKRETFNQTVDVADHIIPLKEEYEDSMYELDRSVTSENRKWLISDFLDESYVYWENNKVNGYYLSKLREGLIIANNAVAGIELLKLKIPTHQKIVLPTDNIKGIEFLRNYGYKRMDTKGVRMIRGQNINWQPQKIFCRIGGNVG